MSAAAKRPYIEAMAIAQDIATRLDRGCARWLIAGSLRRKRPDIGDIELVVIPKITQAYDLFGDPVPGSGESLLDETLAQINVTLTKNGDKFKQFVWGGMNVDLFIQTPETWGVNATIRTGSADFTHWLVTERRHGGAKPTGMAFKDARIIWMGKPIDTSEEQLVFQALELDWIAPEERDRGLWR